MNLSPSPQIRQQRPFGPGLRNRSLGLLQPGAPRGQDPDGEPPGTPLTPEAKVTTSCERKAARCVDLL